MDIKIPFLGDGIDSANVASILIEPGDSVTVDQTLIELETDKATAPVPSLFDGKVESILVSEGDVVKEGMLVVTLAGDASASSKPVDVPPQSAAQQSEPRPVPVQPPAAAPVPVANYEFSALNHDIQAAPSILKFAKLASVDLGRVAGTGHGGRITWTDIQNYLAFLQSKAFSDVVEAETLVEEKPPAAKPTVDFAKFGEIEIRKISSLRQKISDHLSNAWNDIPHVTQFADIQMDHIMSLRKTINSKLKKTDIKLSVTVFVLKAIAETLKEFETFNSSLVGKELIIKKYIHLGVAVDTDAGLVVPVIRDVDKKSLQDIAKELDSLAEKARNKALALDDIQGATFTLSNLGGLGASHFTPIVNSPEVAILGTGRAQFSVSYNEKDKSLSNRLLMPVALSYDHRVIDGADGARFVQLLTSNIESFDKKWVK